MNHVEKTLEELRVRKIIPRNSSYEVSKNMIRKYCELYSRGNKNNTKASNIRYAYKIAGINLMKDSLSNSETSKEIKKKKPQIKCGIVYIISNSAFPGWYKIGITQDLQTRLSSYQTSDPERRFKVEKYFFFENRRETEKILLNEFAIDADKGEWVKNKEVLDGILLKFNENMNR